LLSDGTKPILITPWPLVSNLEMCLAYRHSASMAPFYLVPVAWLNHSPLFRQTLDRHRLNPYSLSLVDRKDVFFLMDKIWLEPLQVFYREHYGLVVQFDMVLNTDAVPLYTSVSGLAPKQLYLYQARSVGGEPTNGTAH